MAVYTILFTPSAAEQKRQALMIHFVVRIATTLLDYSCIRLRAVSLATDTVIIHVLALLEFPYHKTATVPAAN